MPNAMLQSLLTTSKYIINSENGNSGLQTREILVFVIFLILFGLNIHILSVGILSEPRNFPDEIQVLLPPDASAVPDSLRDELFRILSFL